MGSIADSIIANVLGGSSIQKNYEDRIKKEEKRKLQNERLLLKIEGKKEKVLSDPKRFDKEVAEAVSLVSPSIKKPNYRRFNTKTEAVESSIPPGHPLKGLTGEFSERYKSALENPDYQGIEKDRIKAAVLDSMYRREPGIGGKTRLERSQEYKAQRDHSMWRLFGLLGEDSSVRKPEGYDDYLKRVDSEQVETGYTNPLVSAGLSAGLSAGWHLALKGAAGSKLPYVAAKAGNALIKAPDIRAKLVGAAVVGAAGFFTYETFKNAIDSSIYGKTHEAFDIRSPSTWDKEALTLGASMVAGAKFKKAGLGLLKKTVEKDLVHQFALKQLVKYPSAENAVKAGLAQKEANLIKTKLNKAKDSIITKDAIYNSLKQNEERLKSKWDDFLGTQDKLKATPVLKGKEGDTLDQLRAMSVRPLKKDAKVYYPGPEKLKSGGSYKPFNLETKISESKLKRPNELFISEFGLGTLTKSTGGKVYIGDNGLVSLAEHKAGKAVQESYIRHFANAEVPTVLKQGMNPKKVFKSLDKESVSLVLKKADSLGIDTAVMEHVYGKTLVNELKKKEKELVKSVSKFQSEGVETVSISQKPYYGSIKTKPGKVNNRPGLGEVKESIVTKQPISYGQQPADFAYSRFMQVAANLNLHDETIDFLDTVILQGGEEFDNLLLKASANNTEDVLIANMLKLAGKDEAEIAKEIIKLNPTKVIPVKAKVKTESVQSQKLKNALIERLKVTGQKQTKNLKRSEAIELSTAADVEAFLADSEATTYIGEGLEFTENEIDFDKWSKYIIAGAVLTPVALLYPSDSEASVLTSAIPKLFGKKVKQVMTKSAKNGEKLLKEMYDNTLIKLPVNGSKSLPVPMLSKEGAANYSEFALKKFGNFTNMIKRTKGFLGIADRFMSTPGAASILFKSGAGPHIELGLRHIATQSNIDNALEVTGNILSDVVGMSKYSTETISSVMKPLATKYQNDVIALATAEFKADKLKTSITKLTKSLKNTKLKKRIPAIKKALEKANAEFGKLETVKNKLKPTYNQFTTEWEASVKALAKQFPETRIALAAEDTVDGKVYPWLNSLLTNEEKEAVTHIKTMMLSFKERSKAAGLEVIENKPYMHHAFHPDWNTKLLDKRLKELDLDIGLGTPLTKFFRRSKYSKMLMPDINYTLQRYIPDTEKRIQWSSFWGRDKKNSWYALSKTPLVQSSPALKAFFDRLNYMAIPEARTKFNDWANRYTSVEVFRLLSASPSVAFKHAFKLNGTWANLGIKNSFKHLPETFKTTLSNVTNSRELANNIKLMGVHKTHDIKTLKHLAVKTYSSTGRMLSNLVDIDLHGVATSKFDNALFSANKASSVMIRSVEAFDRAHSFLATLDMAAKKGMTSKDAMYGVMDTILKNNFLSGALNPVWMKNPKVRAVLLFQNTPFKILERRVVNGASAVRVGKKVINFAKEDRTKFLSELKDLKNYILTGQDEFKKGVISTALNQEKDFMGTNMASVFMKEMMLTGAMFISAKNMLGWDLSPQMWHTPFLRHDTTQPTIVVSPIVQAALESKESISRSHYENEETEFFITEFLNNWLGKSHGLPITLNKALRISKNDIPSRYKDSPFQYLFSIPSIQ